MRGQRGYVLFHDDTRVDYDPPRNTMDPRYVACTKHQVACDCREAEYNEEIDELRSEYFAFRKAIGEALIGHVPETCACTGCQIARRLGLTHLIKYELTRGEKVPF
jgi:hypothetical protein